MGDEPGVDASLSRLRRAAMSLRVGILDGDRAGPSLEGEAEQEAVGIAFSSCKTDCGESIIRIGSLRMLAVVIVENPVLFRRVQNRA